MPRAASPASPAQVGDRGERSRARKREGRLVVCAKEHDRPDRARRAAATVTLIEARIGEI